jgi:cobalt/nickel transport system permease protein
MHDLLDDYAYKNALRNVNPKLKLSLGLASILICTFSTSPIAPLIVAVVLSAAAIFLAKIPARFYLKLLAVPLTFVLFSCLAVIFLQGGEALLSFSILGINLEVSREGLSLALLLLARTLGGMCALFFIALTTPMIEVFSILKSIGLPSFLIELSILIYRYIFVLLDQAATIHSAQTMRLGGSNIRSSILSFSMLSSVLFLRAWEQGERLIVAMDSRCYDGHLDIMERYPPATWRGMIIAGCYILISVAIAFLTKDHHLI